MIAAPLIECIEADAWTQTFTIKRAGVAVSVSSGTVVLWDPSSAEGTLQLAETALTVADGPNGIFTFAFTVTHTTIAGSNRTGDWHYMLKVVTSTSTERAIGEFKVHKNPALA